MQDTKHLLHCKTQYHTNTIQGLSNNSNELFQLTNNIIGNTNVSVLSVYDNEFDLASKFGEYFIGKIQEIGDSLCSSG